ncbi:MAG: hypothetical protein QNK20_16615 [Aureibaculum sp.]|nr:hypothetical protein [Aureibaculum sp.]
MEDTCKNCKDFNKTTEAKVGWLGREAYYKKLCPQLNKKEIATLANNADLAEQKGSGMGYCESNYNSINDEIGDDMSCKHFKKA